MFIYTRKQLDDSKVTIVFSPNFKWLSLFFASSAIFFSYFNYYSIAVLFFCCFSLWIFLFLMKTKSVRREIKEFTVLDKVETSGSNWNYKNPITYTIKC
ncbi:hypothetical protein CXF64_14665 [Pseudoalteromonas sp. GutCa3]|nr:hypothetical protein CXF64_14665 [Pseudoalteromonas sp. GutCa3]